MTRYLPKSVDPGFFSTIQTGGTAQALAPKHTVRRGFFIRNNSAASLKINELGGTAANDDISLEIKAGEFFQTPIDVSPIFAISIWGGTTGQSFTFREW